MELFHLNDMIKGWFIGDFEPTLLKTQDFEIAVKRYKKGDYESAHFHKLAEEFTIIVSGEVLMNNVKYSENDIIKINKNETTDFKAITDVITVVVKVPSSKNDKYEAY
jgi:mannose-6-phosphate isomerase-like protein (cupin superfamily)